MARRTLAAGMAALAVGLASCGSGDSGPAAPVEPSDESSPFAVGDEPDGYRLVQAGAGSYAQTWSSDSFGDDEPVTVLAPPGEGPASEDAVWVSVTGYDGYEGGLAQASYGYGDDAEEFELDGRPAVFSPARTEDGARVPADLVVAVGDDLAVRVDRGDATRAELAAIFRAVRPAADHLEAPEVPDPPDGLEVVGSADADVAISLIYPPTPSSNDLPAGERGHVAVWARAREGEAWVPEEGIVKVVTLPGRALDLEAMDAALISQGVVPGQAHVERRTIAGRPGLEYQYGPAARAVVTYTEGGDLLLVVAMGRDLPRFGALASLAASVRPTTGDDWERFVVDARGGAELHADDGAAELERGTVDGIEWLLQATVDTGDGRLRYGGMSSEDPDTEGQFLVDPCLKLGDGGRVCAGAGPHGAAGGTSSGPIDHTVLYRPAPERAGEFPGFVIFMTVAPAETVRLSLEDGTELTAPLHPLPGGDRVAGVVFPDRPIDNPECVDDDLAGTGLAYLDGAGEPLPCD